MGAPRRSVEPTDPVFPRFIPSLSIAVRCGSRARALLLLRWPLRLPAQARRKSQWRERGAALPERSLRLKDGIRQRQWAFRPERPRYPRALEVGWAPLPAVGATAKPLAPPALRGARPSMPVSLLRTTAVTADWLEEEAEPHCFAAAETTAAGPPAAQAAIVKPGVPRDKRQSALVERIG